MSFSWNIHLQVLALALSVFAIAGNTFARLSYTSQSRYVASSVAHSGASDSQSIVAPDFGPFDATAIATLVPPASPGFARTHQSSVLGASGISNMGDFMLQQPFFVGTGTAGGTSFLDVVFDVDQLTPFTLMGDVQPLTDPSSMVARTVGLTGPGVNINLEGPGMFSQSGILPVGQYEYLVNIQSRKFATNTGTEYLTNYSVFLTVPEPANVFGIAAGATLTLRRMKGNETGGNESGTRMKPGRSGSVATPASSANQNNGTNAEQRDRSN